jgi:hypothetical protein
MAFPSWSTASTAPAAKNGEAVSQTVARDQERDTPCGKGAEDERARHSQSAVETVPQQRIAVSAANRLQVGGDAPSLHRRQRHCEYPRGARERRPLRGRAVAPPAQPRNDLRHALDEQKRGEEGHHPERERAEPCKEPEFIQIDEGKRDALSNDQERYGARRHSSAAHDPRGH